MKLYNTLKRRIEDFRPLPRLAWPLAKNLVRIYVCGPTVYSFDHLGHARTYLVFDLLIRLLHYLGYQTQYIQNITDVGHLVGDREVGEDKIERLAKEEKKTPSEIARFYEQSHLNDLKSLNIILPQKFPRATEHIPDIVRLIEELIKKGFAYVSAGNVYFAVSKFKKYGQLSHHQLNQLLKAVRIAEDPYKKDPLDFALWKKADPAHLQQWDSPWGKGYPGWHIECSVMSTKYLGQPFDIHGSAVEHIFPHHENEIAQSEAAYSKPLAKYWLHAGMVSINGQKMSKSLKNEILISDLVKKYHPDIIRLAIYQTFWRKPFDYKEEVFWQAKERYQKLLRQKRGLGDGEQKMDSGEFQKDFLAALENDLNTPKALEIIEKYLLKLQNKDFELISKILGLEFEIPKIKLTAKQKELILKREKLRKEGNFKESDRIRLHLQRDGIIIEDTEKGPKIFILSKGK